MKWAYVERETVQAGEALSSLLQHLQGHDSSTVIFPVIVNVMVVGLCATVLPYLTQNQVRAGDG